jgi:hypothetical protein
MTRFVYLVCVVSACIAVAANAARAQDTRNVKMAPAAPGMSPAPGTPPASAEAAAPAPVSQPALTTPNAACERLTRLCCEPCGPDECGWLQADYLLWWVQGSGTPPLAVQDAPGTARTAVGLPNTPGQLTRFGASRLNDDVRSGLRISGGLWLGECRKWAISGDGFFLETGNDSGLFASPGNPPLTRPFFNLTTGQPDAELVSFPGVLAGSVSVNTRNTFAGAGAFLQRNLCCSFDGCDPCHSCGYRIDLLAGYRFYELNDEIRIRENLLATGAGGVVPQGTVIVVNDRFRTENTFHGGLIGLSGVVRRGNWALDFRGGASLGNMHRELIIDGSTSVQVPGQPLSLRTGGLLAQRSNIGRYSSDTFTAIPELNVNLGYQVTRGVFVHVGYSFIYLSNVWRAGDQIDRGIDTTQITGAVSTIGRPAPLFASTGTFVQGVNLGLTFRY